jgi:hypothetical protein
LPARSKSKVLMIFAGNGLPPGRATLMLNPCSTFGEEWKGEKNLDTLKCIMYKLYRNKARGF